MDYGNVERDFVERSLKIIEQYEKHVVPNVAKEDRYEVTLLMNCLLGLIVLPFEHSKRKQGNLEFPEIFKGDDVPIISLDKKWGLNEIIIECFKINGISITNNDVTLRKIIAMFRHSMAHSQFGDGAPTQKPKGISVNYSLDPNNAIRSVIVEVNFTNKYKQRVEFRARIPVNPLKQFAISTANAFIAGKL